MKKLILLLLIGISLSSCYSIKQALQTDSQKMTKCTWTD